MNIPKVEFSVASLKVTLPIIQDFLNPRKNDWDWSGSIYRHYPELKNRLDRIKDINKRKKIEKEFFEEIFYEKKDELEMKKKIFQKEWNKVNDKIMIALSEVMEQKWPKQDRKIYAGISLNPICPRWIKDRSFDVFYDSTIKQMKETVIHEASHFLYFEKWKKVFPQTKEEEFDYPYLVWKLSEMVPAIILNDKKIQEVFRFKFGSYDEFQNFLLNGQPILSYLQEFYDNRESFEDFLVKSWEFVKGNEKEINSI